MSDFSDVIFTAANSGQLTVTTTAAEAKISTAAQDGRQRVLIFAPDSIDENLLYWDVDSSVNISTTAIPFVPGEVVALPFGSNVPVYLKVASGTVDVTIQEWS